MKDVYYILTKIVPEWVANQRRLKERRGSWRSYLNLTRRFHEIGQDPYVRRSQ